MAAYLDNRALQLAFVRWRESESFPEIITDEIAEAFQLIAHGVCSRHNFREYTYDLEPEAVFACVRAARHFDPVKSKNPFGYFSQVAWRRCIDVLRGEKRQRGDAISLWHGGHYKTEGEYPAVSIDGRKVPCREFGYPEKEPEPERDYGPFSNLGPVQLKNLAAALGIAQRGAGPVSRQTFAGLGVQDMQGVRRLVAEARERAAGSILKGLSCLQQ